MSEDHAPESALGRGGRDADEAAAAIERRGRARRARQEALLDEALQETFPASDPISPAHVA